MASLTKTAEGMSFAIIFRSVIVLVLLFLLAPSVVVVLASLGPEATITFPPPSLSLKAYGAIPERFLAAFGRSLVLGLVAALGASLLGTLAGLAIVRGRLPGKRILDLILRSPLQVPMIVSGVAFLFLYVFVANHFGINLRNSLLGLSLAHISVVTPYVLTSVVARLATLEEALEEAAYGLGASPVQAFFLVTLPLIRPAILGGAFLSFLILCPLTTFPSPCFW